MNDQQKPHEFGDERLSGLYRHSRTEEPPMALDSAILQRARAAIAPKRHWWLKRFWIAPLATAAVALLTVSVVIEMRQQQPKTLAPAPSIQQQTPAKQLKESLNEGVATKAKRSLEKRETAPAAPAGQALSALPRQASPAPESRTPSQAERKAAQSQHTADRGMQTLGNRKKASSDNIAQPTTLPPETWLQRIQALIKAGKTEEAKKELAGFVGHYPDYPLPPALQSLRKGITTPADNR